MARKKANRSKRSLPETPTCNCVLLCDDVLISAKGKHTLAGIIGVIAVPKLPAIVGGFVAYVRISNVYGDQRARVSLDHAKTGRAVFEFQVPLQQRDPLGVYTVVAPTPPFAVDEGGRYIFQVESRGEVLAQSPIEIVNPAPIAPSEDGTDEP